VEISAATEHRDQTSDQYVDDELVGRLVAECSKPLYGMAVSIVRDHALAEDIVQETLVKAWQAFPTFRGDASLVTWVLRIGHNTAISALRRIREDVQDPASLPVQPYNGPEERVVDRMAVEAVWSALDHVDPLSRSMLILRDVEGLSYGEVEEITGASPASVKTRLFRARRNLADILRDWR